MSCRCNEIGSSGHDLSPGCRPRCVDMTGHGDEVRFSTTETHHDIQIQLASGPYRPSENQLPCPRKRRPRSLLKPCATADDRGVRPRHKVSSHRILLI
ncbi:Sphingolipid long chain base-responsive protein LSP1 [Fusarium oxysporum f. sp. albedinis]|nr:Sphingolipid long chain base-responsive protein LSP1 [Fusarium oxysporum f. sp. albedinis]